jgi:hypothetical protein
MKLVLVIIGILFLAFSAFAFFYGDTNLEHHNRVALIGGGCLPIGIGCFVAVYRMRKQSTAA